MNTTEKNVFGSVESPLWMKYTCYKVACKTKGKTPSPPAVWVCAQTLMLIDKGHLQGTDRKDAEEALNALGWESYKNIAGQLCLRPCVPEWCEEHEQAMWKDGLKCGGCLEKQEIYEKNKKDILEKVSELKKEIAASK